MREILHIVQFRCIRVLTALMLGLFTPAVLWAQATLENPQPGSFQSGIGLISGWICNANRIDIEVDGAIVVQAAYGTLRGDTSSVCGDVNNGFGLLVNWNLLGDGTHTLRVLADGGEIARSTFVVTTLGLGDFPRDLSGSFTIPDFPQVGRSTRIQWQESLQNFVITNASGISNGGGSGSAGAALENPQPGSFQSGIGLISGWICNANRIDIEVDGAIVVQAAYGTLRGDTTSVCGDANNGFGLLVNWNLLGDGTHTLRALADGGEIARSTFVVTTLGLGDFPRDLSGSFTIPDFPQVGKQTRIQWQESLQNFVIRGTEDSPLPGGCANIAGVWAAEETINATCTIDGEPETLEVTAETDVTIAQTGCSVSWESPESVELGIPPRTALLSGNTLQGSSKFVIEVPDGPKLNFTQNTATYEGVISGDRIELSGSGNASGEVCQGGDCVNFSCTGTSTGLFTR